MLLNQSRTLRTAVGVVGDTAVFGKRLEVATDLRLIPIKPAGEGPN